MNITKEQIKEWVESRSERIAKHIELRGNQAIHYAVGEMIVQCIQDIAPNIQANAVLKAAMDLDLYSVHCDDTDINVGDELADYASKIRAGE